MNHLEIMLNVGSNLIDLERGLRVHNPNKFSGWTPVRTLNGNGGEERAFTLEVGRPGLKSN